ncbi:MAG: metal-dependent transcriptional regulator [Saprospiraceae bacterium]|nr:metal-dependent transcriptional regulator [Saprospiraceae bacterium]
MELSATEENYLKAIFKIGEREKKSVSTNSIARHLETTAASVTDMIKRLAEKDLIHYQPYKGVTLSTHGNKLATNLIRRHRLWEVFLVNKLRFAWHQVHDLAEELEHIGSEELIMRLDAFLDYPRFDPHGDPIPNAEGKFTLRNQMSLSELLISQSALVVGVKENQSEFLKYLTGIQIKLGTEIKILQITDFDRSMRILVDDKTEVSITSQVSQNILVRKN